MLDRSDENHTQARTLWFDLLDSGRQMFTSNYVIVECCALAQNRLGFAAVRVFHTDILPAMDTRWIDDRVHALAITALLASGRRKLSLVDCSSFALMRENGARLAFAFDRHFGEEGFHVPGFTQDFH